MFGRSEARQNFPELLARARGGEVITIGNQGVPEVKMVRQDTPLLTSQQLLILAGGLAVGQANNAFRRSKGDPEHVAAIMPDNVAADVVMAMAMQPETHEYVRRYISSFMQTSRDLYAQQDKTAPGLERVIVGISMSSGADLEGKAKLHEIMDAPYRELKDHYRWLRELQDEDD